MSVLTRWTADRTAQPGWSEEAAYAEGEPHAFEYVFGLLRRRAWIIVLIAVVGTLAASAVGLLVTPRFTARVQLLLEPGVPGASDIDSFVNRLTGDPTAVETQIKVLTSAGQLGAVVDALKLATDPEFVPPKPTRGDGSSLRATISEWIGSLRARSADPAVIVDAHERDPREVAIGSLSRAVTVTQEGRALVLSIAVTSKDPDKAAAIANAAAGLYIQNRIAEKETALTSASTSLGDRVAAMREQVAEAEEAVHAYRSAHGLAPSAETDVTGQRLLDLSREAAAARADLDAKQARLDRLEELRTQGAELDSLPAVAASPVIVRLRNEQAALSRDEAEVRTSFGTRHPRVVALREEQAGLQRKIQAEVERIASGLRDDVAIASNRTVAAERELNRVQAETSDAQVTAVQLRELEREATSRRELYEGLLKRYHESLAQDTAPRPDARVLSPAETPRSPSSLGPKLFAAAGLVISALLGGFVAAMVDRLDRGLRNPGEVRRALGLRSLALVPKLTVRQHRNSPQGYLMSRPMSAYAEAVRYVLAATAERQEGGRGKVVMITSALPGEGKTTLALSLSLLAARSELRTLIVDLDLRRPSVTQRLRLRNAPGIVDLVEDGTALEDAVQEHRASGLAVLGSGRVTTNALAIVRDGRLARLLDKAAESYDLVVLDTGPVLAVADTQCVARLAGSVLMALQWNKTNEQAARTALGLLNDAGANVAGAVLTQVNVRQHATYGYADAGAYHPHNRAYFAN